MNQEQLKHAERLNAGTAWTKNKEFDKNGYIIIKNLYDPTELECPVPEERGLLNYINKDFNQVIKIPVETQVEGSLSRYWYPQYREAHNKIRFKLEEKIGRLLYKTYYYDRFYFSGQELTKHTDRDACEISVTVHVGTNLKGKDKNWPIWIKTPDTYRDNTKKEITALGKEKKVILKPGDGMVYKGCERPHWREPMPGARFKSNLLNKEEEFYYHQIFFHYVLQDGQRAHCAFDAAR